MESLLTRRNIIIAAVLLIVVVGTLIYFGSQESKPDAPGIFGGLFPDGETKPSTPQPTSQNGVNGGVNTQPSKVNFTETSELPLTAEEIKLLPVGALIQLSADNIASLASFRDTVRYHKNTPENLGHLFERKADGSNNEIRLSNFTIPKILRVVWAPDGARAVIFYDLDIVARKLLVDYTSTSTPKTNFLPDSIYDVAFSPDSKSLAFINNLGESHNIFVATADFKNARKVADNNIPDLELSWPSTNILAVKTKSSFAAKGFLYVISVSNGSFTKIAEGYGLDAAWSPDGSGALYSTTNTAGKMLPMQFFNMKSQSEKEISVGTVAEKCVFLKTQKNRALCALPRNQVTRMPDEWWKGKVSFLDNIINIDTTSGEWALFVSTESDIISPRMLRDDSFMVFKDKTTGMLWGVKLK